MKIKIPATIQFHVCETEKKAFKEACDDSDLTMSQAIRRLMRLYVQDPDIDDRRYYSRHQNRN